MTQAKLIEYAYPTSTHATKEGFGKTGCWFVVLYPSLEAIITKESPVFYSDCKEAAIDYAEAMPEPYNCMHKYFER